MLKGKTALVTGSTSGIGLAIARAMAADGANVVINGFGDKAAIEKERAGLEVDFGVKAIYSPADLERENVNLIGGDSLSGSHHLDQNFLFRPVAGYSRYATPIAGLYMCGASTWPGAGTAAGSGFILAKMLGR